jgi:hypothetical protein
MLQIIHMSFKPSSLFDVHMYIPKQLIPLVVQYTGYIPYTRKPNLNIAWEEVSTGWTSVVAAAVVKVVVL